MLNDSNNAPASNSESNSGVSTSVESNQTPVANGSMPEATQTGPNTVAPASSQTAPEQAQTSKRLYEREEVNRIAAHAAREAAERARADFERNKQYSTPQSFNPQYQQQGQAQSAQSLEATELQIRQIAFKERMRAEASSLTGKLEETIAKYNDFPQVTDMLDDLVTDHTAPVFNSLDNAGDVIYHLGKNPESIPAVLEELAKDPFNTNKALRARRALDKISQQLKANAAAKNQPLAKEPVQHDKPTTAAMDSGKAKVADLRKMKQYRA
jgi:hypothetical protein